MADEVSPSLDEAQLSARQRNELEYHRTHAAVHEALRNTPVPMEIVRDDRRRWWNPFWHLYSKLRRRDWHGKRVLIPGCGFGEDAARFANMGAQVEAFDLSPESVAIARARCDKFGYTGIRFAVMPCEKLDYPDSSFDVVYFCDMLHHVDIPKSIAEARRVLKPGGEIIGMEIYTHSTVERVLRRNPLVDKIIYPLMKRYIYGTKDAYITADEHKIDDKELDLIRSAMTDCKLEYFYVFMGRLFPARWDIFCKMDRCFTRLIGGAGRILAARVLFSGTVAK
jgi:ubiquinone/menaquinone biosynthesis C-methylase UbiE